LRKCLAGNLRIANLFLRAKPFVDCAAVTANVMRKKPKSYYYDSRSEKERQFDRAQRVARAMMLDRLADLELQSAVIVPESASATQPQRCGRAHDELSH
jgi:hypothetical protein